MKYCLTSRQPKTYLKKADEIIVPYKDRRIIPDLAKEYPEVDIVLEITPNTTWDFDEIKEYHILSREKLILCIPEIHPDVIGMIKEANIRFFWGYEINTPYELAAMVNLGVCYVRLGAPLFFQTDIIKKYGIPGRVTANVAHGGYLPHSDGVNGAWIRPEDVDMYEGTIGMIEFSDCDISKEQALFRIYAEQKNWPGSLDMLISNLGADATNRMIPPEFTEARLNCGQRCAALGACRLCYRHFALANPELIKNYVESMNQN